VGVAVKHRQLTRQVEVFIKHPLKNSMVSFRFTTTVLDKGTTFIFGPWIFVANGLGGSNNHQADSKKLEASTPTRCSDLDEFVDNLDELLLPDLAGEIEMMFVFDMTSTRAAPGLLRSDSNRSEETTQSESLSNLEEDLDRLLKIRDEEPPLVGGPPFWQLLGFRQRVLVD
jgi:hypothetical protein